MKVVGFYFILTFIFFLLGQVFWTVSMLSDGHFFGDKFIEDMIVGHSFTASGLFGLLGSFKLYNT